MQMCVNKAFAHAQKLVEAHTQTRDIFIKLINLYSCTKPTSVEAWPLRFFLLHGGIADGADTTYTNACGQGVRTCSKII